MRCLLHVVCAWCQLIVIRRLLFFLLVACGVLCDGCCLLSAVCCSMCAVCCVCSLLLFVVLVRGVRGWCWLCAARCVLRVDCLM